jgi:hypothetical protein
MLKERPSSDARQTRTDPDDASTPASGDMRQRALQVLDGILGPLLAFGAHPLSMLWLMAGIAVAGGIIEWVFLDRSPWEGFEAAGVIAGVVQIVAHVKGIPAWPWETPKRARKLK